ncbi:RiPP maturation radical SAM protein 1 [Ramlibacter sp. G-1-2-2]|uniref:RiPP maturation radical SAM protein 1 n=1 Tax=Ramlibacter agri TaxID=2728837 RepID=A0A848GX07_9BURK|nr:RiPP maturation radical SAM C-methyltransferase [Ramlibacter agri]NML43196.1 RiPP maturation radical SAM protein 1 [Ramlibacter agri]
MGHLPAAFSAAPVVLASMPFGILHSPSLALGILQARLAGAGIRTACRHFTIDYAARIGTAAYQRVAGGFPRTTSLLGEWIFSHAIRPKTPAQQETYFRHVFGDYAAARGVEQELRIRSIEQILGWAEAAGDFVDYAAREILAYQPRMVCLTSVFEQNLASIALAQRLHEIAPGVTVVMGGANCEGEMGRELARRFPCIDVVVSGEGDRVIVPLVEGLLRGERWQDIASLAPLVDPQASAGNFLQARMVHDLGDPPRPDFDAYFHDLAQRPSVGAGLPVEIPMESSRGCWWGEKHHCTFCGLNGATMGFRSKAPDAVVREVQAYAASYPGRKIAFVDNIMDSGYFATLLPELARLETGTEFFYEIKSNVTRAQVRALRDAGVRHIQPGIESLSDHVLGLMKKGVSAMQNLQLLKWCMEYAVRVDWNVLWGFPGESPEDYEAMARMVPWLVHLEPPARGSRIRLDRHSPNFKEAEAFGFTRVRPYPAYGLVHDGLPAQAVAKLAYFFEADHALDAQVDAYTRPLAEAIACWHEVHARSTFFSLEREGAVVLVDTRPARTGPQTRVLQDVSAQLVMRCDTARTVSGLARELPEYSPARIREELDALCAQGVVWSDGRRYLGLAVAFTTFLESRRRGRLEQGMDAMLAAAGT